MGNNRKDGKSKKTCNIELTNILKKRGLNWVQAMMEARDGKKEKG